MTTLYSIEEVSTHNTKSDLWTIIHGQVYDITPYIEDHPGGVPVLIETAGQDATVAFEELGHSDHAREVLEKFLIGKLDHGDDDDEAALPKTIPRQLSPEPLPEDSFLDTAILITIAEIISMSAIVTIAFIVAQRFGRLSVRHATWPILSTSGGLVPWLTSTSLASLLIKKYVQRKVASPAPVKRPAHFKVEEAMLVCEPKSKEAVLKAGQYIDLPVASVEKLSRDSNKIILDLPSSSSNLGLPVGQHITIRSTIDGKEVSRSYTPTSSNKDLGRLELVIKNYDAGLLTGQYLRDVQVGDNLSISGPKGKMHYRRGLAHTINMVAGGTGITPMYQLIRAICEDPLDDTKVVLVYANQTEADILLKAELDAFASQHSNQFKVHYLLSKSTDEGTGRTGRCTSALLQEVFCCGDDKHTKAMLCGPSGMVESAKDWLAEMGYERANTVSRMSDQVFVF